MGLQKLRRGMNIGKSGLLRVKTKAKGKQEREERSW